MSSQEHAISEASNHIRMAIQRAGGQPIQHASTQQQQSPAQHETTQMKQCARIYIDALQQVIKLVCPEHALSRRIEFAYELGRSQYESRSYTQAVYTVRRAFEDFQCFDDSSPIRSSEQTITHAIDEGVPLYNSGNTRGCHMVYIETALVVAAMLRRLYPEEAEVFDRAVSESIHSQPSEGAWTLRHAFDEFREKARAYASHGGMAIDAQSEALRITMKKIATWVNHIQKEQQRRDRGDSSSSSSSSSSNAVTATAVAGTTATPALTRTSSTATARAVVS